VNWFDIRFAYTHTLNYPDFRSIVPRIDIDSYGYVDWNNADLKPARSENFDLYMSFYTQTIGLFTIGGFTKNISDLIFPYSGRIIIDVDNYEGIDKSEEGKTLITNLNNPYKVNVQGIELDWQTHFFYLPGLLSGLILNANYTHIFSSAKYPRQYIHVTHLFEPPWVIKENVNSFYRNRLIDQPDDIINLAIGYDFKDFSVRISMLYQKDVFKEDNFWPELRQISDDYMRWDLAVKQDLPWPGLQLFGNYNNIFNEKDIFLIKGSGFPAVEQHYGSSVNVGLRYNL
jgi:outer membrane receptor protein involved in Fe transport